MKRKYVAILPGVLTMVLLLALACSTEEPTVAPVAAQPTEQMAAPADEQSRLDIIKARGKVVCAGRTDLAGFGYLDDAGVNQGFDIDLCRAVAAAVFGDASSLEIIPISASERGPTI